MEFWNDRWERFLKLKSLRPKLLLIVALALGPLALASIGQGLLRFQTRHEEIDTRLLQMAMYATGNERGVLSGVELYLQELAHRPDILGDDATCAQTLSNTLVGRPLYLNVILLAPDGRLLCGASNALLTSDYSKFPWWPAVRNHKGMLIGKAYRNPRADKTVLPVVLPIRDRGGAFVGAISASLDMAWLNRRMEFSRLSPVALMMILDRNGTVVASNHPPSTELARQVASHGWHDPKGIFTIRSGGKTWQWVAQPVTRGEMIVAFGAPELSLFDMSRVYFLADILLPLLMIALASVAIWLGTEWLVIRWTTYLQRVSAAYAQNHFALEMTELESAPEEFRQLGYEMKNMAGSIRDRDSKLNRAIVQETAMAREIHHRVKNNLQIVSSLISLYSQRISDAAARVAFRQIVVRVDTLTLVHRLIEKNDTMPVIDVRALFTEMGDQMRGWAAEAGVPYRLAMNVEQHWLPAAVATPIALFAAEALSFEMFHKGSERPPRIVKLTFAQDGPSHLLLVIEDGCFTEEKLSEGMPSPQRVLRSFSEQLQAHYWIERSGIGACKLLLRMPVRAGIAVGQDNDGGGNEQESPAPFHFRAPGFSAKTDRS